MVLASFLIKNKLKKIQIFKETFLLADISKKMGLKMFFLIFINIDI